MFRSIPSNIALAFLGAVVFVTGVMCAIEGSKMLVGSVFVFPGVWSMWGAISNIRKLPGREERRPHIIDYLVLTHVLVLVGFIWAWFVSSVAGFLNISRAFGVVAGVLILTVPLTTITAIFTLWSKYRRKNETA